MGGAQGWAEEAFVGKADPPIPKHLRLSVDILLLKPSPAKVSHGQFLATSQLACEMAQDRNARKWRNAFSSFQSN